MSLDETVNLERLATAMEKIATAFEQYNILYAERLSRDFPPERPKRAAEITRSVESQKAEHYSDKASDDFFKETEAATGPSRFQQRYDEAHKGKSEPTTPKRRRVAEVH